MKKAIVLILASFAATAAHAGGSESLACYNGALKDKRILKQYKASAADPSIYDMRTYPNTDFAQSLDDRIVTLCRGSTDAAATLSCYYGALSDPGIFKNAKASAADDEDSELALETEIVNLCGG